MALGSAGRFKKASITDFRRLLADRFSIFLGDYNRATVIDWGRNFLPHYFSDPPSMMHLWLSRRMEKDLPKRGKKYVVIGPRFSAKSVIAGVTYPMHEALSGRESYILLISDTYGQAVKQLGSIKQEIEWNSELKEAYPHSCGIGAIWREDEIQLRNGCKIQAIGRGSKIRGTRERQNRPSLIIADDIENDDHITSSTMRESTKTWFNRTVMNLSDNNTNFLALGSAIHRDALVMSLMKTPGWTTRRINEKAVPFRSIERWPDNMDLWRTWEQIYLNVDNPNYIRDAKRFYLKNKELMDAGVELLWPEHESLIQLMKKRAEIGHTAFEAEKQGNPINPETCEWPEEYFNYPEFWFDEWPEDVAICVVALDPSKGKSDKTGDYSAIATVKVTSRGTVYADVNMARRPTPQMVSDTVRVIKYADPYCFVLETNQYQELLSASFEEELLEQDVKVEIEEVENRVNKNVRIRRLGPLLAQHRLRFKNSKGSQKTVDQMKDFANGDYDDGPDAVEMAIRLAFKTINVSKSETVAGYVGDF